MFPDWGVFRLTLSFVCGLACARMMCMLCGIIAALKEKKLCTPK